MMEIKRIMRYLKGTKGYGLWYKKGGTLELKAFIDTDWVGSIDDRKSTSGGAFFLGKRLVPWTTEKSNCISQSIEKAKYVVVIVNYSNIVWFKQLLTAMKVEIKDLVVILCDNTSAINKSKNSMMHTKIKHIAIKYHFLR